MSVKSIISTEMSRTVVQTVAKPLYGHEFFLIKEEANEKDQVFVLTKKNN